MHDVIPDIEPWLPEGGFLRRYCEWTSGQEGPLRFQFWTALSMLSAAVGRRYWIDKGYFRVFPNLYVLLVAPTGKCRKSTTAKIGLSLLNNTDVRIVANKITPEELIFTLQAANFAKDKRMRNAEALLFTSELTVLLGRQSYNEGLIDLLTDWADAPDTWSYASRGGGKVELHNVGLTLLACSTADWLGDAIPQRAYSGGFLARIVFIVQEDTSRVIAIPPKRDPSWREALHSFLLRLRHSSGEFHFTDEGLEWYNAWYASTRGVTDHEDLRLNGYYERRPDHLLRVAMLLALSEQTVLELTPSLMTRAALILEAVEPTMSLALKRVNLSQAGRESLRLIDIIGSAKDELSHPELLRMATPFMSMRIFEDTIRGLKESNKVLEYVTPMGRFYRLAPEGNGAPQGDEIF